MTNEVQQTDPAVIAKAAQLTDQEKGVIDAVCKQAFGISDGIKGLDQSLGSVFVDAVNEIKTNGGEVSLTNLQTKLLAKTLDNPELLAQAGNLGFQGMKAIEGAQAAIGSDSDFSAMVQRRVFRSYDPATEAIDPKRVEAFVENAKSECLTSAISGKVGATAEDLKNSVLDAGRRAQELIFGPSMDIPDALPPAKTPEPPQIDPKQKLGGLDLG